MGGLLLFMALALSAQAADPSVVVYRARAAVKGRWTHPSIYSDGKELTRLYRGTFFQYTLPPGKHIVTMGRTEVGQFVEMESGKTYYFRFGHKNIFVNAVTGRAALTLEPVDEATAKREMEGLKRAEK